MFKINLSSFSKQTEIKLKIKANDVIFDEDISINKELDLTLALTKDIDNKIIIQGEINGEFNTVCARCLEKFIFPVNTKFTLIYKKKDIANNNDKIEDGIYIYDKNEIDLFDYLRETLLLELPVKPLCNQNCKGLCPVCGKNLNKENCNCEKKFKNRPFDNLNLKRKKED